MPVTDEMRETAWSAFVDALAARGHPTKGCTDAALDAVYPMIREAVLKEAAAERELWERWQTFCDCDPFPGSDDFGERMEAAGLLCLRPVTKHDLDTPFAYEKGIEPGGSVWDLTDAGRLALAQQGAQQGREGGR